MKYIEITARDPKGRIAKGNNLRHGLSNEPIYDCWVAMKARCLNNQHPMYSLYGGRGISVCTNWVDSFDSFYAYMGDKPSPKHTLDRVDVNGNYEPNNCRWITHTQQQSNRRDNCKFVGVNVDPKYKNNQVKKYRAEITRNGKKHYLGLFNSEKEAYRVRLEAEQHYGFC